MKKAKTFLIALTVLVVAGGALAFKVKTARWFAFCDTSTRLCTAGSLLAYQTTLDGVLMVTYDEYGKQCKLVGGVYTCTTLITFAP